MACRWWSARPPTAASRSICRRADALILQDPRNGAQLAQALERLGSEPELRASLAERGSATRARAVGKRWRRAMRISMRRCCANGSRPRPEPYAKRALAALFSLPSSVATMPGIGQADTEVSCSSQLSQCIACSPTAPAHLGRRPQPAADGRPLGLPENPAALIRQQLHTAHAGRLAIRHARDRTGNRRRSTTGPTTMPAVLPLQMHIHRSYLSTPATLVHASNHRDPPRGAGSAGPQRRP